MSRKFFKRFMPNPKLIREHKSLRIFGTLLQNPNLWHLNRHSIAGAVAVGLFVAWVPVPFQMILAAGAAILFRTNLPMSVGLVWITNPVTMPLMFYGAYIVGTWIINVPETSFSFELSMDWIMNGLSVIWQPFLLGCFVLGVISSITGYFTVHLIWRYSILKKRSLRHPDL